MSEQPQAPGWWLASDGKYYPPELRSPKTGPALRETVTGDPGTPRSEPSASERRPPTRKVRFVKPPKLHVTEDGVSVRFDLLNYGDSSVSANFRLTFKGDSLTVDAPTVQLKAGSGPTSVKIDLPTDGGFTKGSKVRVEVQGPGGTTLASSSTGTLSVMLPGGSHLALGPGGVKATAIVGLGAIGTMGFAVWAQEPSPLPEGMACELLDELGAIGGGGSDAWQSQRGGRLDQTASYCEVSVSGGSRFYFAIDSDKNSYATWITRHGEVSSRTDAVEFSDDSMDDIERGQYWLVPATDAEPSGLLDLMMETDDYVVDYFGTGQSDAPEDVADSISSVL